MSRLSTSEIKDLLDRRDRWMILTTIGPDGFPHTIPMGYFLVGERVILPCLEGTRKVKNIDRNPRVSLLWENGRGQDALIGILMQGEARVVRDRERRMALKREACALRGEEPPKELSPRSVYLEVTPHKTVSWNRPTGRHKR